METRPDASPATAFLHIHDSVGLLECLNEAAEACGSFETLRDRRGNCSVHRADPREPWRLLGVECCARCGETYDTHQQPENAEPLTADDEMKWHGVRLCGRDCRRA